MTKDVLEVSELKEPENSIESCFSAQTSLSAALNYNLE